MYNPPNSPPPLSMTRQERMKRLYDFLIGMGHMVFPKYNSNLEIEFLTVSIDLAAPIENIPQKNTVIPIKMKIVTNSESSSSD